MNYDILRKKNAFLDNFKKIDSFSIDEFDDSKWATLLFILNNKFQKKYFFACREVIQQLIDEYKAMEEPTYLDDFGEEDENNWVGRYSLNKNINIRMVVVVGISICSFFRIKCVRVVFKLVKVDWMLY